MNEFLFVSSTAKIQRFFETTKLFREKSKENPQKGKLPADSLLICIARWFKA